MCVRPYVRASVYVFVCMCVTVGREVGSSVNARLDSVLRQLFIFSLTRRLPGQTNFFCNRLCLTNRCISISRWYMWNWIISSKMDGRYYSIVLVELVYNETFMEK